MTTTRLSNPFRTKDLPEAAYISCHLGMPNLERNSGPSFFLWNDSEKATQLSRKFWDGEKVSALKYSQTLRTLKDLIFSKNS